MAGVVAAMALTHSPGLTGWFDRAPEDQRREARRALDEMRDRLRAARPDVIVLFSNDHLLNWPINNTPEYTVGIGAEHVGPADWYDEWLALDKYRIPGHPAIARYLVNEGARRRIASTVATVLSRRARISRSSSGEISATAPARLAPITRLPSTRVYSPR